MYEYLAEAPLDFFRGSQYSQEGKMTVMGLRCPDRFDIPPAFDSVCR